MLLVGALHSTVSRLNAYANKRAAPQLVLRQLFAIPHLCALFMKNRRVRKLYRKECLQPTVNRIAERSSKVTATDSLQRQGNTAVQQSARHLEHYLNNVLVLW